MNNQSMILLALGAFVALIVAVVAVTQSELDEHPITEVGGLIWNVGNEFDRIQDLEATLQVTDESKPGEYVRVMIKYVKAPTPVFSMRYVPPETLTENVFMSSVGNETYSIENDQLSHHIPSENIAVIKRWPGIPLVDIGLAFFKLSQVEEDWEGGVTEIRILQNPGFSEIPAATSLSLAVESFSYIGSPLARSPGLEPPGSETYALHFSLRPDSQVKDLVSGVGFTNSVVSGVGFTKSVSEYTGGTLQSSHILEIRDAQTKDLQRMIWIDPETLLVQKIVTFRDGERSTTFVLQRVTIDQGITASDIIVPRPSDALNIRG